MIEKYQHCDGVSLTACDVHAITYMRNGYASCPTDLMNVSFCFPTDYKPELPIMRKWSRYISTNAVILFLKKAQDWSYPKLNTPFIVRQFPFYLHYQTIEKNLSIHAVTREPTTFFLSTSTNLQFFLFYHI